MKPERNQAPTATVVMYAAVGANDLGKILRIYGSRTRHVSAAVAAQTARGNRTDISRDGRRMEHQRGVAGIEGSCGLDAEEEER